MNINPNTLWDKVLPGPGGSNFSKREGLRNGFKCNDPGVRKPSFSACKNESDSDSHHSYSNQIIEVHNEPITYSHEKKSFPVKKNVSAECKPEKSEGYKCVRYLPKINTFSETEGQRPEGAENFFDSLKSGSINEIYFRIEHIGYEKLRAILPENKIKIITQKNKFTNENDTIKRLLYSLLITVSLYNEKELAPYSEYISNFLDVIAEYQQCNTPLKSYTDLKNACVVESNKIYEKLIDNNIDRHDKKAFNLMEELVITPLKEQLGNEKMEEKRIRERAINSLKKRKEIELHIHGKEKLLASADLVKYIYYTSRNVENIIKGNQ